jgi:CubicO group peptidase (beta-lactamase class C family)
MFRTACALSDLGSLARATALVGFAASFIAAQTTAAQASPSENSIEQRIQALVPNLEDYVSANMKSFDVPGLAIGIVASDKLVYARGFGVRSKGGAPVDTQTLFQIGSVTKEFLSTTMAIAVDQGKLHWEDRIVDLDPEFQLRDPWVTREFRLFDLTAQRSGLPPYVNDFLTPLGFDRAAKIRSLRYVDPVSSFRSTFAYLNIPHILAGRIVARAEGAADWNAVLQSEILDPLGMKSTTYSAAAIAASANHAVGHRYTVDGSVETPFEQLWPYDGDGAADINSNIEDMAKWVSFQLANGALDGRPIVSPANLAYTRTPRVAINDKAFYALGWIVQPTPNGDIVFHSGITFGFAAIVALQPDRKLGVIVLSNQSGNGMTGEVLGLWTLDRLLGNPMVDHGAIVLAAAKTRYADELKQFARPADPGPSPPLAPLAANFSNPAFGKAALRTDAGAATLELAATGAKLRLDPWNGAVYTVTLAPEEKFAPVAANLGPLPMAFAQFQNDKDGQPTTLRFTFSDGQAYDFEREQETTRAARFLAPSAFKEKRDGPPPRDLSVRSLPRGHPPRRPRVASHRRARDHLGGRFAGGRGRLFGSGRYWRSEDLPGVPRPGQSDRDPGKRRRRPGRHLEPRLQAARGPADDGHPGRSSVYPRLRLRPARHDRRGQPRSRSTRPALLSQPKRSRAAAAHIQRHGRRVARAAPGRARSRPLRPCRPFGGRARRPSLRQHLS